MYSCIFYTQSNFLDSMLYSFISFITLKRNANLFVFYACSMTTNSNFFLLFPNWNVMAFHNLLKCSIVWVVAYFISCKQAKTNAFASNHWFLGAEIIYHRHRSSVRWFITQHCFFLFTSLNWKLWIILEWVIFPLENYSGFEE